MEEMNLFPVVQDEFGIKATAPGSCSWLALRQCVQDYLPPGNGYTFKTFIHFKSHSVFAANQKGQVFLCEERSKGVLHYCYHNTFSATVKNFN